ncbi:MAG: hypothetical protein VXW17_10040 [Pseudomonadota bacterium]|nr:hypothetical protein [Pseudomonadota bacterium]
MRRYLIIAIAIMAAILVMSLVKVIQARRARARGEIPHKTAGIDMAHVIGGLVGLAVFFLGAVMLETGASSPGSAYEPAQLKDGKISSGRFTEGPDGGE